MSENGDYDYGEMVRLLAKSGDDILNELTPHDYRLLATGVFNAVMCGERIDDIKKQVVYQKDQGISLPKYGPLPEGLTAEKMHLFHMAIGIFGEAAELLNAVYGHVDNNEELDMENVVEELGDIEFFMEGFRQGINKTRASLLQANITKLGQRYDGFKYSDAAAQNRSDKTEDD